MKKLIIIFLLMFLSGCGAYRNSYIISDDNKAGLVYLSNVAGRYMIATNQEKACDIVSRIDELMAGNLKTIAVRAAMIALQKKYGIGSEAIVAMDLLVSDLSKMTDTDIPIIKDGLGAFKDGCESAMNLLGIKECI